LSSPPLRRICGNASSVPLSRVLAGEKRKKKEREKKEGGKRGDKKEEGEEGEGGTDAASASTEFKGCGIPLRRDHARRCTTEKEEERRKG